MTRRRGATRRRPVTTQLAATVALVIAFAACETPAASVAPTPTRAPEADPRETVYELWTDVWYEGLVLHMDRATAILDARGGTVDITFRIENPGTEAADLDARTIRSSSRATASSPTRESHIPSHAGRAARASRPDVRAPGDRLRRTTASWRSAPTRTTSPGCRSGRRAATRGRSSPSTWTSRARGRRATCGSRFGAASSGGTCRTGRRS